MPQPETADSEEVRVTIELTRATRQALKVRAAEMGVSVKRLLLRLAADAGVEVDQADLQDSRAA